MTNDEFKMLKLFISKSYSFKAFDREHLKNPKSQNILLSLSERNYLAFDENSDTISISTLGKIEYQRHISKKHDSFREWLNRSFILGSISGILVGIIVTLLSTFLLGLLHL